MNKISFTEPDIEPLKELKPIRDSLESKFGDLELDPNNPENLPKLFEIISNSVSMCGGEIPINQISEVASKIEDIQNNHLEDSEAYSQRTKARNQEIKAVLDSLKDYAKEHNNLYKVALAMFKGNSKDIKIVLDSYIEAPKQEENHLIEQNVHELGKGDEIQYKQELGSSEQINQDAQYIV